MKDELTEKMHSEFEVTPETEKKHTVWNIIQSATNRQEILNLMIAWDISPEEFKQHKDTYPDVMPFLPVDIDF